MTAGYATLDTDFSNELQEALAGKTTLQYTVNTAASEGHDGAPSEPVATR